ncbi:complement factor H-like [Protobothrops mucrosquamatus]|uniref:complement factor H-like n=1 Tax=Protobothrops mucrosquamatus TaxID=103944 RepID=UPI0007755FF9|nr:complement factor H-like [Protobothrops mucrosquamatus]
MQSLKAEITCSSPRISNGSFRPKRSIYYDRDLIQIQCNNGFTFEPDNGGQVVECTKKGWSPPPKCVLEMTCQIDHIEHGTILSAKFVYKEGERIWFSCNEGYRYVGRPDALCTKNGWSTKPQCTKIQCPPPEVRKGYIQPSRSQYMYNDEITIFCRRNKFFKVMRLPRKISKCTANGWNPPALCGGLRQ